MRSFLFYLSCINCLVQLCLVVIILYYWYTNNEDVKKDYNPYGILCSVTSKKYRSCVHFGLALFSFLVFHTSLDHFYEYCLDDENSYDSFKERRELNKKKKRRCPVRRKPRLKTKKKAKPKPRTFKGPTKDGTGWWLPNGDHIITESIEEFALKNYTEDMFGSNLTV